MYLIATKPIKSLEDAQEELSECYDNAYRIYKIKEEGMEVIAQHRKLKSGIEMGFPQEVMRGKHGRFTKNPFAKRHFSSIIIGLLFIGYVSLVLSVIIGKLQSPVQQEVVSPIPTECEIIQ